MDVRIPEKPTFVPSERCVREIVYECLSSEIVIGGVYLNLKNRREYIVDRTAICATNGREDMWDVIYELRGTNDAYTREVGEFLVKFKFTGEVVEV